MVHFWWEQLHFHEGYPIRIGDGGWSLVGSGAIGFLDGTEHLEKANLSVHHFTENFRCLIIDSMPISFTKITQNEQVGMS